MRCEYTKKNSHIAGHMNFLTSNKQNTKMLQGAKLVKGKIQKNFVNSFVADTNARIAKQTIEKLVKTQGFGQAMGIDL